MPFNGSGTFTRIYNWVIDKANGINITASRMDADIDDIANGLSQCINKNGQTILTANIPFNNYKITGLNNGAERNDSINVGQVQDNQFLYLGTTSGSADAYTLSPAPTITAYASTQQFVAKIHATNATTTPYLQISGIANPTTTAVIKKLNASKSEIPVAIGDLVANSILTFQRNSTNTAWIVLELSNPATTTTQGIAYLSNPITVANNATTPNTDIDFSGGVFNFSDGTGQALASALTKRLQSSGNWSAGAGGNLLTTGARANSSTYHLYAIYNPTTLAVDYMALLGVAGTAPDPTASLPSGYTKFKRVGSILTDGSGNIRAFTQRGNSFELTTPVVNLDATASNGTTLQSIQTPAGIAVKAAVTLGIDLASGSTVGNYYVSLQNANQNYTPSAGGARSYSLNVGKSTGTLVSSGEFYKFTNTSSQIRVTQAGAGTLCSISLTTNGWEDYQLLN